VEVCTPKQTVNYVNQSNKGNIRPSNHSSLSHNLTNKQGSRNINHESKLTCDNKLNVVNTMRKNPKNIGSDVTEETGGTGYIAKTDNCNIIVGDSQSKSCAANVKTYL
jgi:hypothetical protein